MKEKILRSALLLLFPTLLVSAEILPIVNPNFEADGGPFVFPTGWLPFGEGGFEGHWEEGDWKAAVGDPPSLHSIGFYQIVPNARPGTRYRLTASARGGGPQTPVRIGLVPGKSARFEEAVWSEDHYPHEWKTLTAEAVALEDGVMILLEFRNINPDHPLIQRGAWDEIRLVSTGEENIPLSPPAGIPEIFPATDVYGSLGNLWSLAWPREGIRAYQASSHDPHPEGNADFSRFEGTYEADGDTWTILKSIEGRGTFTRLWVTEFASLVPRSIRIEVDGKVFIQQNIRDFFGTPGPFRFPLTARTSGSWVSHTPIPFRESFRISVNGRFEKAFYWHVNYWLLDPETETAPFPSGLPESPAILNRIQDQWAAATMNPKPEWPGTREATETLSLDAGEKAVLWEGEGPGIVDAFWLAGPFESEDVLQGMRLRAYWDGSEEPQVSAPLGLFFAVGFRPTVCRGLLLGMAPPDGGYCYFPMPFRSSARIELENDTGQRVDGIRFRVRWVPLPSEKVSPLRFHAHFVHEATAGQERLFIPLEARGQGHFVGLSAAMSSSIGSDHYLEGDEYFWVDDEEEPSWAGTGTEDYFTCGWYFFNGPITLPTIGATTVDRNRNRVAAYRLHPADYVPFTHSLRFGLEVGNAMHSPEHGDYRTVCYYYLGVE